MTKELSKAQIDKLGKQLRADPDDPQLRQVLQEVRRRYDPPLREAQERMRQLGLPTTARLKTETTIVEKLIRQQTRLSSMQDIAGLRLVRAMSLEEQDELAETIKNAFGETKTYDRRVQPSAGYRALHIVVIVQGFPVEIQIRTELQDLWAQVMERLADRWGRGIRYGELPKGRTRRRVVRGLIVVSVQIAEQEGLKEEVRDLRDSTRRLPLARRVRLLRRVERVTKRTEESEEEVKSFLHELLTMLDQPNEG